jgi:hypothetical protein
VDIPYVECKDGEATQKTITLEVRKGTVTQSQKDALAKSAQLALKGCSSSSNVVTFPDSWAGKITDDRPQAVVYYREWNGSKFGDYKHHVSIPHYSKPKGYKPSLPTIKKGSFFGILTFKDNSKIHVNCESINEAKRVVNALKQLSGIKGKGAQGTYGEIGDRELKKVTTKPVRLDFYSKGRENSIPDWSVDL